MTRNNSTQNTNSFEWYLAHKIGNIVPCSQPGKETVLFILRPCQHANGYTDDQSQI